MIQKTRIDIAREAAKLLYHKLVRDYQQAKNEAARNLKVKTMPSNFEVATELDAYIDEVEGINREKLIIELRQEALIVLRLLEAYQPRLIGSVWRGTARSGSDIDIEVFSHNPKVVIEFIAKHFQKSTVKHGLKTDKGETHRFLHIYFQLPSRHEVEVVVKSLERVHEKRRCEVYGDTIVGLSPSQLAKILKENPSQRYVPQKR